MLTVSTVVGPMAALATLKPKPIKVEQPCPDSGFRSNIAPFWKERKKDRQKERQKASKKERQTGRNKERKADRKKERQTEIQTDKQKARNK